MKRPDDKRRKPKQLSPMMRQIDRVCAQMNGALTAVAIALAILVTLTAAVRAPSLLATSSLTSGSLQQSDD
jgi:hypothetical protein